MTAFNIIAFVMIIMILFVPLLILCVPGDEQPDYLEKRTLELHKDQMYDGKPYTVHLKSVAETVTEYWDFYGDDAELRKVLLMAAWFHDTLEDVPSYTYNDLKEEARKIFSDEFYVSMVAEIVYACTTEKGRNRKERANDKYYAGIRETGYAPFIKACDRLSNIRYASEHKSKMEKTYKKELPDFLKHIEAEDNPIPPELKEALCHYLEN